jgi:hypothetical protein
MADDGGRGGTPACFLDEVDPAYAGYLTDAEVSEFLAALLARERVALGLARALGGGAAGGEIAAIEAVLVGELARRPLAQGASPAPRFARSADSRPAPAVLAALEAELMDMLEATVPRIASDALHDALNRALAVHRTRRARRDAG